MHISITGMLGSGKSTVCKIISKNYGFEVFSTGTILREIARERGIDVLELNKQMKSDSSIDHLIDDTTTRISCEKANDKLIFDSRMAWNFAEKSFKIFVTVKPEVAAARVFANPRGNEEKYISVEDAKNKLVERSRVENQRFKEFYGKDYYDKNNYDLVIDSSSRTPEEIVNLIMRNYEDYCTSPETYQRREFD